MSLSVIVADCVLLHCTKNKDVYQRIKELELKEEEVEHIGLDVDNSMAPTARMAPIRIWVYTLCKKRAKIKIFKINILLNVYLTPLLKHSIQIKHLVENKKQYTFGEQFFHRNTVLFCSDFYKLHIKKFNRLKINKIHNISNKMYVEVLKWQRLKLSQ